MGGTAYWHWGGTGESDLKIGIGFDQAFESWMIAIDGKVAVIDTRDACGGAPVVGGVVDGSKSNKGSNGVYIKGPVACTGVLPSTVKDNDFPGVVTFGESLFGGNKEVVVCATYGVKIVISGSDAVGNRGGKNRVVDVEIIVVESVDGGRVGPLPFEGGDAAVGGMIVWGAY